MKCDLNLGFHEYFYYKYIKAIACSNNPSYMINYLFENFKVDANTVPGILAVFKLFVLYNFNYLDNGMKDNMYSFISFLKTIYNDLNVINELIILVNRSDDSKISDMVFYEYVERFNDWKMALKTINDLDSSIRQLKNMNIFDVNLLVVHSRIYDDVAFTTNLPKICSYDFLNYAACINMIISECPSLLSDDVFSFRVCTVCDIMYPKIYDRKVKKIYNKFKKNFK